MPEQHIQLMKGLGFSDEQIQAVESLTPEQMKSWKPDDPEALKVFNPNELVTHVQTGLKNVLSNDPEFLKNIPEDKINPDILKKIEKGQYARFQNELVEVATKKLGLEDKELTEEDRKSIKGLAEKMAVTYLSKKGNVQGLQEMQTKLSEALQNLESMKAQHTENLKTELEKVNGANTAKLIKTLTKVELSGLDGVKLAVGANFIADPVLSSLSSKYAIVLDENDNLDLKQKANPQLDVLDGTGKKMTFQQALRNAVIENKLGTEEKEEGKDEKRKKIIVGGGDGGGDGKTELVPSYIADKINANPELK